MQRLSMLHGLVAANFLALGGMLLPLAALAQGPRGNLQRLQAQAAEGQDIDGESLRAAIRGAIDYLKQKQLASGAWEHWPQVFGDAVEGGTTSLYTLALLNGGLTKDDPSVARALAYLRSIECDFTYAIALQTMVFCAADPERDLLLIKRNAERLQETMIDAGEKSGGWNYRGTFGDGDNSNSQFAVLALYEAERAARRYGNTSFVSEDTWKKVRTYWTKQQWQDGSWSYPFGSQSGSSTGSMTCAGLASLIMASDMLEPPDAVVEGDTVRCCGEQRKDDAQERGLAWLASHFSVARNPGATRDYHFYYLYALERVGRLTNNRFIGGRDWFREGSYQLINRQPPDPLQGYWRGSGHGETVAEVTTSLAVLFLCKGRRPVVMAKLKHGPDDDWNHHRHDAGNLTNYAEDKWKRDLTWQTIDPLRVQRVEDLLQTPVLYITGRDGLELPDAFAPLLRDYLDRGGFLFAESCCDGGAFDEQFRSFMTKVFSEEEYRLRPLEPTHPVWRAEEAVDLAFAPPLWGIDAGCRTAVVYCPGNLGCYWELLRGRKQEYSGKVESEIATARAVGINVLAYATNREVKFKDEIPLSGGTSGVQLNIARGVLSAAKIKHPGGCDAAPLAIANLMKSLGENLKTPSNPQVPLISLNDPQLFDHYLVFMHGRNSFRLSDLEREQLRTYVERGGVLIADSICGSDAFTQSFRDEMKQIFPSNELARIPDDHPMFTSFYGGGDVRSLVRRRPDPNAQEGIQTTKTTAAPELEGVLVGDRYGVLFSRFDISCALENKQSLECPGYERQDAARLAVNLVLYAMQE